ncbi:MAG: GDP-mannose 4,6-dehydratase [bacterium]|nr:GDP-mannose 4,6-dehydratase [bacterium]
MKNKIVITGGAGFIGSHLGDALLSNRYEVVAVDNLSMGKIENIKHNLVNPDFRFEKVDIRDIESLKKVCKDANIIVHLAAYKIPRYGNAVETLLVNGEGGVNVFKVAKEFNCKVVLASTSDVYGKSEESFFQEDGNLIMGPSYIPRWSYAVSKLFEEHLAYAYQDAYNIPVNIIRIFECYGPRYHLSWWGGPIPVFISAILSNKEVEIHNDGKQTRCFIYISDLVDGIISIIEKDKLSGEIFNLGTKEEISILDLVYLIKDLSGSVDMPKIKFVPYSSFSNKKYEDIKKRTPDITKAGNLLKFAPKMSLREGLLKTIDWQRGIIKKEE